MNGPPERRRNKTLHRMQQEQTKPLRYSQKWQAMIVPEAEKGIQVIARDEKMQLISPELYNFSDDQRPHTALALREVVRGTSTGCTPAALRVHDHVSLHFSTTDNGPRAAACLFEDESAAYGRRALQSGGAILG